MIHYHGLPITPESVGAEVIQARHAFVSFAHPCQLNIAIEYSQSFAVDNGAFSMWKSGKNVDDWSPFYKWVDGIKNLPNFDFAVIPDVIDGDEIANDDLLSEWPHEKHLSAPVWHMHESIERFYELCHQFPRVCIGSSGAYANVGDNIWWNRMNNAISAIYESDRLPCKLHGLRMLNPAVFRKLPLASADSTNIARNIGIDSAWRGTYPPATKSCRAMVMAKRIESYNSKSGWENLIFNQKDLFDEECGE